MSTSITLVLWLQLTVWGIESDGTVNHLLETMNPRAREYAISISTPGPLPVKPHTWFQAKLEMECDLAWTLHNDNLARAYICNANKIFVNGKVYHADSK